MSNDQPSRKPAPRGGGAPMGSTISIVIAVIAVVVGFLILKNINDSDDSVTSPPANSQSENTSDPSDSSSTSSSVVSAESTTPTTAVIVTAGATVIVANASKVPGSAGQMTEALQTLGFTLLEPTNGAGIEESLDITKVYYKDGDAAAQAVAAGVVQAFNGGAVVTAVLPAVPPVTGGDIKTATVLVMLGKDFGGKALPILAGDATETTPLPTTPIDTSTSATG